MSERNLLANSELLSPLVETCREDASRELWLAYRKVSRGKCTARLVLFDGDETHWVGGPFSIPSGNFLGVGALRKRTGNGIRIDECTDEELAILFWRVSVPFRLGWSPDSVRD